MSCNDCYCYFLYPLPSQSNDIPVPKSVDISISGIFLDDSETVKAIIGEDIDLIEPSDFFPHLKVVNKSNTELLILIAHPGSVLNTFNEVIVRKKGEQENGQSIKMPSISHFVTGNNIRLGISSGELVNILGKAQRTDKIDTKNKVVYEIGDFDKSEFLKYYNMPYYYGEYVFIDDKLVKFKFGFSYP